MKSDGIRNLYVLDTDTCIYWLKGTDAIRRKVEQVGSDCLAISIVTLAELRYGAYYSQRVEANLQNIHNFLRQMQVLLFDEQSTELFGSLKADLRRTGQMIEDFDLVIAATTVRYGGILVTNNVGHFQRIAQLSLENWLEEEQHAESVPDLDGGKVKGQG